ncbi:MAG: hypothetical protein IID45_10155 [Planctomycetes bacterium]|nr:hypothetical protein [Planctomycetota bacterium]
MARKSPSRLDKRREVEAAEALEKDSAGSQKKKATTKKKAVRKKAAPRKRAKVKADIRKRLVWGVFNGNMKEEGRFPYFERDAAEKKIEQLRTRSPKKMFFIQPIKEDLPDVPVAVEDDA